MNFRELIKIYLLNKYILIIIGVFFAFHSSKPILENEFWFLGTQLSNEFWFNDQGSFFNWARQSMGLPEIQQPPLNAATYDEIFNLRILKNFSYNVGCCAAGSPIDLQGFVWALRPIISYKLFISFISIYFVFFENPFLIVFTHKLILSLIFILFFYKNIVESYGYKILMLLFFCFSYLNLFFLRDSLFFLVGLTLLIMLPTINLKSKVTYYFCLVGVFFLRPQSVFFFIKWKYTILLFLCLILLYLIRDLSFIWDSNNQFNWHFGRGSKQFTDVSISNFNLTNIVNTFSNYLYDILLAFHSINPFTKFTFYLEKDLYINFILLFVSSVFFFLFVFQMFLGIFIKSLKIILWRNILSGLLIMMFIYSYLQIPIDLRVLTSSVAPFFIFFNNKFLRCKPVIFIIFILFSLYLLKISIF